MQKKHFLDRQIPSLLQDFYYEKISKLIVLLNSCNFRAVSRQNFEELYLLSSLKENQ